MEGKHLPFRNNFHTWNVCVEIHSLGENRIFRTPFRSTVNSPIWGSSFILKIKPDFGIRMNLIHKSIWKGEETIGFAIISYENLINNFSDELWIQVNLISKYDAKTEIRIIWEKKSIWQDNLENAKIIVYVPSFEDNKLILYPCKANQHKDGLVTVHCHPPVVYSHYHSTSDKILFDDSDENFVSLSNKPKIRRTASAPPPSKKSSFFD